MNRPERKIPNVAADDFRVAEAVRDGGHVLVLRAGERPELPAAQAVAGSQMENRIKIIVGDDVAFLRLAVNWKHHEENPVPHQPILEMAVKRDERGVIVIGVRRALLEMERENREAPFFGIILLLAAGETEQLDELPAILRSVSFISQERINKIIFPRLNGGVCIV